MYRTQNPGFAGSTPAAGTYCGGEFMPLFRKPKPEPEPQPVVCNHKWQDFPWYIDGTYYPSDHREIVDVYEPYVCIHCKERKDIRLLHHSTNVRNRDEADEIFDHIQNQYKEHLRDRAEIEDMINDMQFVDAEYLKYYRMVKELEPIPKPQLK